MSEKMLPNLWIEFTEDGDPAYTVENKGTIANPNLYIPACSIRTLMRQWESQCCGYDDPKNCGLCGARHELASLIEGKE